MSERQAILQSLKTEGELTAAQACEFTGLTSMGARGHLERLADLGWVSYREQKHGRGRPKRLWFLTTEGHQQFGQQYELLSVEMLDSIRELFGEQGLQELIQKREQKALAKYQTVLAEQPLPETKIQALAAERSKEGYMAEVIATDANRWQLIEHHCPICAAAENCQGFCEAELSVFQQSLGSDFNVQRSEHLLNEGQRCRYEISLNKDINKEALL